MRNIFEVRHIVLLEISHNIFHKHGESLRARRMLSL